MIIDRYVSHRRRVWCRLSDIDRSRVIISRLWISLGWILFLHGWNHKKAGSLIVHTCSTSRLYRFRLWFYFKNYLLNRTCCNHIGLFHFLFLLEGFRDFICRKSGNYFRGSWIFSYEVYYVLGSYHWIERIFEIV